MENKIVILSGAKGGTGKSLVCGIHAMYLWENGIPVVVLDADIQQSLQRLRSRELQANPDVEVPYALQTLDATKSYQEVKAVMEQLKAIPAVVLIDCPGNVSDPGLQAIYECADIAVIPTRYDYDNLEVAKNFAGNFKKISNARVFFVPNSINKNEEKRPEIAEARDLAYKFLKELGYITPAIKQGVSVRCYSTIKKLDKYQRPAVKYAFKPLLKALGFSFDEETLETTEPSSKE